MRKNIIGRDRELAELEAKYNSSKSELVVIYGRRRVGKSVLISEFIHKHNIHKIKPEVRAGLMFEGLENQKTPTQIKHFVNSLKKQIPDSLLQKAQFSSWEEIFDYLTTYFASHKTKLVVAFDEFQWMAANQSKLVALVKYYWDNHWKQSNIMLIVCGSIASFMVKKVINSKALYGRFSLQMHLRKLQPQEAKIFFKKTKSNNEILRHLMVFGGVPKYLEEIDMSKSFEQNIEKLFFEKDGLFLEEFDKIFNVHFKEPRVYLSIIKSLNNRSMNLKEISESLKMTSSGGVKQYLENLETAEFINSYHRYLQKSTSFLRYKISDEFVNFYCSFVLPNKKIITTGGGVMLFRNKIVKQLVPWFGFAFENFFLNNAIYFAQKMGFADKVEYFGPYFEKGKGVQVDLLYLRSDQTISVCEMKFRSSLVSTEVIPEFEAKLKKLDYSKKYSIHKILVAPNGVTEALKVSKYFDQIVLADQLL